MTGKRGLLNKKSQMALEFLTTYSWAFIVILVMMGTLAYFGVLKPSKLLPDRCTFSAEMLCLDHSLNSDGEVHIRLKNNVGEPIVIPQVEENLNLTTEASANFECESRSIGGTSTGRYLWSTNEAIDLSFTNCNMGSVGFVQGEKGKVSVEIEYHSAKSSATYTRQVQGEVFATII